MQEMMQLPEMRDAWYRLYQDDPQMARGLLENSGSTYRSVAAAVMDQYIKGHALGAMPARAMATMTEEWNSWVSTLAQQGVRGVFSIPEMGQNALQGMRIMTGQMRHQVPHSEAVRVLHDHLRGIQARQRADETFWMRRNPSDLAGTGVRFDPILNTLGLLVDDYKTTAAANIAVGQDWGP